MKEFWNERYSEKKYAYGLAPNQFFKEQFKKAKYFSLQKEKEEMQFMPLNKGFKYLLLIVVKRAKKKQNHWH